jgi:hypothetical protein
MGTYSAAALLGLPVRLHSIQLARPVDLLVDATAWRALGFLVESSDGVTRFLPFAASQPAEKEIEVHSALMLLDDAAFYRKRGVSLRALLGEEIRHDGEAAGTLLDVLVDSSGRIRELELEQNEAIVHVPAVGSRVAGPRLTAA